VKSGWAVSILIGGSARSPHLCESDAINLSDPRNPETRQPYHAAMGRLEMDTTKLKRRMQSVRHATEKSVVDLLKRCADKGYKVRRAALVVGSVIDPDSIANPHIRAHALEGRLFRTTLETALQLHGIQCAIFIERDTYAAASKLLGQSHTQNTANARPSRPFCERAMARGSKADSIGCLDNAVALLCEQRTNWIYRDNTPNSETQCDYGSR